MTTPHARTTSCKPGLLVVFTKDDIALQLSIDGAQLYRDKASDCWMFIWIIHNLHPLDYGI